MRASSEPPGGVRWLPGPQNVRLQRDVSWSFGGNVAYALSQWLILIAFARWLPLESVGRFALALAIVTPVMALSNLSLRTVQATDAAREHSFALYLMIRAVTGGVMLVLVIALTLVSVPELLSLVVLVAGFKLLESLGDIAHGYAMVRQRIDRVGWSKIVRALIVAPVTLVFVKATGSLGGGVTGMNVGMALALIVYDWPLVRRLQAGDPAQFTGRNPDRQHYHEALGVVWRALPLGLGAALIALQPSTPRYLLAVTEGERGLAVFAATAYLMTLGVLVSNALGESTVASLARASLNRDQPEFVAILRRVVVAAGVVGGAGLVAAATIGTPAIGAIYGSDFADHSLTVLIGLATALAMIASSLGYALLALHRFRSQFSAAAAAVVSTVIVSIALIPPLGVRGAAAALCVGFMVQGGISLVFVRAGIRTMGRPSVP